MVGDMNLLELRGRKLAEYRLKRVGFLWQQVERNLLRHRSALRNVTLPMMLNGTPFWIRTRQAHELLDAVGMASHAYKHPAQLSGGQQQRVALAVALANHPNLLLADEPTGALDRESSAQVMALFQDLRERYDLTILMVSHDLAIARYADRVLTLRDGALGQDLSHEQETGPRLDNTGRIQLPEAVRSQLVEASHIAVEIRPEGVLLRPENDAIEDIGAGDALLQDAPPQRRARLARLRHLFRRGQGKTA
jgi:ABC-type lipoprotein export system ATPase subunit